MSADQAKPGASPEAGPAGDDFDPAAQLSSSRALTPYAVRLNTVVVRRGFWPKIRKLAVRIPFAEDAVAMFFCAFDRETPAYSKAILLAALAYFILPTDFIPDVFPVIGFTDDAAVIAAALAVAGRSIQPRHRQEARRVLEKLAGLAPSASPPEVDGEAKPA